MERASGPDAGRVSQHARFDVAFVDDMTRHLAETARQQGVEAVECFASEETASGMCSVYIHMQLYPVAWHERGYAPTPGPAPTPATPSVPAAT
jgi:hypothetical protein